jgi:hypothetical protein
LPIPLLAIKKINYSLGGSSTAKIATKSVMVKMFNEKDNITIARVVGTKSNAHGRQELVRTNVLAFATLLFGMTIVRFVNVVIKGKLEGPNATNKN